MGAVARYYVKSKETGNVYGPMTAGDRGDHCARGYTDVTDQHTGTPPTQPAPRPSTTRREPTTVSPTTGDGSSA